MLCNAVAFGVGGHFVDLYSLFTQSLGREPVYTDPGHVPQFPHSALQWTNWERYSLFFVLSLCVCLLSNTLHNAHVASVLSIYLQIPSVLSQEYDSDIMRTVFRIWFLPAGLLFLGMYITLMYLLTSPLVPRKVISLMQESGVLAIIASRVGHYKERHFHTHRHVHVCRIDVHLFVKIAFFKCVWLARVTFYYLFAWSCVQFIQIGCNYLGKYTGQLSAVSLFLVFVGALARIFVSLQVCVCSVCSGSGPGSQLSPAIPCVRGMWPIPELLSVVLMISGSKDVSFLTVSRKSFRLLRNV